MRKPLFLITVLALVLLSTVQSKVKAQTLITDDITLEQLVYSNKQKGVFKFNGITEKHTFTFSNPIDDESIIADLKKDERVVSAVYDRQNKSLDVVITKKELKTAEYWLLPIIENKSVKVKSHVVKHYNNN